MKLYKYIIFFNLIIAQEKAITSNQVAPKCKIIISPTSGVAGTWIKIKLFKLNSAEKLSEAANYCLIVDGNQRKLSPLYQGNKCQIPLIQYKSHYLKIFALNYRGKNKPNSILAGPTYFELKQVNDNPEENEEVENVPVNVEAPSEDDEAPPTTSNTPQGPPQGPPQTLSNIPPTNLNLLSELPNIPTLSNLQPILNNPLLDNIPLIGNNHLAQNLPPQNLLGGVIVNLPIPILGKDSQSIKDNGNQKASSLN